VKRLVLLTAVVLLLPATSAPAALYWGHDRSIGVANLDLSTVTNSLTGGFEARSTVGLAVDSSHLFFAVASNDGSIGRADLDGTSADEAFISGLEFPSGLATDGSHVYWADRLTNLIGRAGLDGSGVQRGFIGGADHPCGVAVDGGHVYWSNLEGGSIGRANLDGSQVEQDFISGVTRPCGVAVTGSHVYWTSLAEGAFDPGSIGRAPIGGGPAENDFITGIYEAFSLAANSTHLFWTDEGWENFQGGGDPTTALPGAVGRARLDGTEVERRWLPTGLAHGVAVDSRVLPGPPPPPLLPAWYLRYGPLTRERSGALRLVLFVPGPGSFSVDSPAIGWHIQKPDPAPGSGFARWTLRLWPGKGSQAAKKIRRQLQKSGRAPVRLRLTYQQEGHEPLQSEKRLAFLRRRST
jgi:virginiamycin B lyase